jgi:probable dihydroxyacetone kinase regulator
MTKKIFAQALKNLMITTPFAKIGIGDITKECEMNRNSFYYHFKDKYELLNWIFLTELTEEVNREEALEISSWELLDRICVYFYNNRKFYANAMSYEGQDSFLDYFREVLSALIDARAGDLFQDDITPDFREFALDFLLDAAIMTIARWLKNGAKYPPEQFAMMMRKAATGAALRVLENENATKLNIPRETVHASAQSGPVFHEKRSGNPRGGPLHKAR